MHKNLLRLLDWKRMGDYGQASWSCICLEKLLSWMIWIAVWSRPNLPPICEYSRLPPPNLCSQSLTVVRLLLDEISYEAAKHTPISMTLEPNSAPNAWSILVHDNCGCKINWSFYLLSHHISDYGPKWAMWELPILETLSHRLKTKTGSLLLPEPFISWNQPIAMLHLSVRSDCWLFCFLSFSLSFFPFFNGLMSVSLCALFKISLCDQNFKSIRLSYPLHPWSPGWTVL